MSYPRHDLERYGADPDTDLERVSDRSRAVALALGVCGGAFGMHRFYAGRAASGVWMILTLGGMGLWWMYDVVMLLAGEFRDASDRPIRRWMTEGTTLEAGTGDRQVERLTGQVERLERDVAEIAERLDFAERMLARQRDRDRLPNP